jgi:hypothetical protein
LLKERRFESPAVTSHVTAKPLTNASLDDPFDFAQGRILEIVPPCLLRGESGKSGHIGQRFILVME